MEITTSPQERAACLLERMRETPMRRGALARRVCRLRRDISRAILAEGVPAVLAQRVAFQLVVKFQRRDLYDQPEWRAIGRHIRGEAACLRTRAGLSEQRIVAALPKLSAAQILEFFDELTNADRRIARTILHAALNTSEPLSTGRRYLAEYQLVVRRMRALDPSMARTLAAATFSANVPVNKAMEHLHRFSSLIQAHQDNPEQARMIARACYRAKLGNSVPS